jgi:branched-chain amino acid transport system substrate-binding protein
MKKLTLLFIGLAFISTIYAQQTLKELNSYAKDNIEYPASDNNDLLNPDYTKFHQSQAKGFFGRNVDGFLSFIRLKSKPVGNINEIKKLLDKITKDKERGDFIYKFTPKVGYKFVIWGDLHGAFHSLVRDLEKLKKLKIIDDNLKISDGYSFVFNGNVIDRSPYIVETLYVVMLLIDRNPEKVFYVCGNHEGKHLWYSHGLKREIDLKTKNNTKKEKESLLKEMNAFFEHLPLALFLKVINKDEFICISHLGLEENKLKEKYFADFLKNGDSQQHNKFDLSKADATNNFANIEVIIKGQKENSTYKPKDGLNLVPPDLGSTAWSVFSSPTISSQKNYSFFYDSFAIVDVGKDIYNWKISSYYKDIRTKKGFEEKSYYLVSTQSTAKPPCDGFISVGSSLDLSNTIGVYGVNSLKGLFARIERENRKGGIDKKYLKLIVLDDKYKAIVAKENIKTLLDKYKTDIILIPQGSATLQSYLSLVKDKKVLVLFPETGAEMFRSADLQNIVNFRASYSDEATALVDYAIKVLKKNRLAFFYQDDAYGKGSFLTAKKIITKHKIKDYIGLPYLRGMVDFKEIVEKIKSFEPSSIFLFSVTSSAMSLIRQMEIKNLVGTDIIVNSILTTAELNSFVKAKGLNLISSHVMPNIQTSSLEIVKEYKRNSNKLGYPLDPFGLEGYIGASLFIDILKKIDEKPTKENIIKYIEGIKNYKFKGLELNFNPKDRQLANYVWIESAKGDWKRWKGNE